MGADFLVMGIAGSITDPRETLERLRVYARDRGGWAQLVDADHVVGKDHLASAYEHAKRALERGTNTASSIELEFLLYASGERQIAKAIGRVGVRPGRPFAAVFAGGIAAGDLLEEFGWERDDRLLEPLARKLRASGFTEQELESAGEKAADLVLERVARVDLLK